MLFLSKNVFFLQSISLPPAPPVPAYNLDYLVIAGGGAGGSDYIGNLNSSAGGGAGGYRSGTLLSQTVARYFITIGAGSAKPSRFTPATRGFDSSLISTAQNITSTGGGSDVPDTDGGSGAGTASVYPFGLGIAGQGNNGAPGGNTINTYPSYFYFGGGGGAGQAGQPAFNNTAKGGDGLTWFDGIIRAGGGGGLKYGSEMEPPEESYSGPGGAGGGGNGLFLTFEDIIPATPGAQNTGGGGGSGLFSGYDPALWGKAGGSGIVKVRYTGTPRATGGTITQSGGFTYHEFTSSGILTFTS
jgi:hypothetical protein